MTVPLGLADEPLDLTRQWMRILLFAIVATLLAMPANASATDYSGLPPFQSPAATPPYASPIAGTEISARLDSSNLQVAGVRLNATLLRRFYARHGFTPIWESRQSQVAALTNAVFRADEHGLDPNAFHAALIARPPVLSPVDRDLLLSDVFLAYADALARGMMPIEERNKKEALTPEPIDVVAALDAAVAGTDPAGTLDTHAPNSPAYAQLRQAYRAYRSTNAMQQAQQVAVALERLRWLPRAMPPDRVEVNTANAQLQLFRRNVPVFTTRVVVGETDKQTPEFRGTIEGVLFNPSWYVPRSIATHEILPKLRRDPGYLARHHMVSRDGAIVQLPGAGNALGQLKLDMPNRYNVYLHDTPMKDLFSRDNRRQSHGCVRVQNPRELAALLLQEPVDLVNEAIALGYTHRRHRFRSSSCTRRSLRTLLVQSSFIPTFIAGMPRSETACTRAL